MSFRPIRHPLQPLGAPLTRAGRRSELDNTCHLRVGTGLCFGLRNVRNVYIIIHP